MDASLGCGIAGCNHYPSIGELVLAELAIEDQLVASRLRHLRCGGQLIEKEDAFPCGGKKLGRDPFSLVRRNARQTAKIDGIELYGPHIQEVVVEIGRHLAHDLRFADTAWSPDMQGHTFADQRMKRLIKFRRFHSGILGNE